MEVEDLREMFQRSESRYGVRYTTFIGDGDSASHSTIPAKKPYGPDVVIEKKECVGHVQKRAWYRIKEAEVKVGDKKVEGWKKNWR